MLIGGIVLGLIIGLLAGGDLLNLSRIRLRWAGLIFVALIGRYATEWAIGAGVGLVDLLRLPLYGLAFGLLLAGLWVNRDRPGITLGLVGIASNTAVILLNGGRMPVWQPSLLAAGFTAADVGTAFHTILPPDLNGPFLARLGFLGDVFPIPIPVVRNVASVGDLFLTTGLGFFLFSTVLGRTALDIGASGRVWQARRQRFGAPTGLVPGLEEAAALERPLVLGAGATGAAAPGLGGVAASLEVAVSAPGGGRAASSMGVASPGVRAGAVAVPAFPALSDLLERLRRHPYIKLAVNGSFSALWTGQLISLFGDRVHQVALLFLVLRLTDSPVAVAAVLVVTTIPNLFLGPIAGAYVDRWDAREVMIVADLLRAALVMAIPMAALSNLALVFPLVFGVTAISIFFRPARVSVLTRLVDEDDLLASNSAMWVGETLADIVGYPLAGLFVAFLGEFLPLAFWIDAATYGASAILITSIIVRPIVAAAPKPALEAVAAGGMPPADAPVAVEAGGRVVGEPALAGVSAAGPAFGSPISTEGAPRAVDSERGAASPMGDRESVAASLGVGQGAAGSRTGVLDEAKAGWRFLRHEPVLLANTIQAVVGQVMIGIVLALLPLYARDVIVAERLSPEAAYSFLEAGIGLGNLVGGFAVGLVGARLGLGRLVIVGYALTGGFVALLGLTASLGLALGIIFGVGVGNLIFVIPSQTLFQQRTPAELMGRVIGLRYSLTFGAMTLGIAVAGVLGAAFGSAPVIGLFGLVTLGAGLAGLLVPAVRDA